MSTAVNEAVGDAVVPPSCKLYKQGKAGVITPYHTRKFLFSSQRGGLGPLLEDYARATDPALEAVQQCLRLLEYVSCQEELALLPDVKESMCAAKVKDGCNIKLYHEPFDHSPTLSAVERVVKVMLDFSQRAQPV